MTLEKIYNKWLSIQPLSEADQNKLSMRFTVEYNYNSNHLEGNTLTYGQTELLLLFGKVSGEGHLKDLPLYTHPSIRGWKWTNSSFNGELYSFKTWMADDSGTKPEKTRVLGGLAPN